MGFMTTPLASTSYKPIRPELVLAGILFHDYGKLFEYEDTSTNLDSLQVLPRSRLPPTTLYWATSIWVPKTLSAILKKFGVTNSDSTLAVHCVLAHHGTQEFGSPVIPAIFEAFLVHSLDQLSARRYMFDEASHAKAFLFRYHHHPSLKSLIMSDKPVMLLSIDIQSLQDAISKAIALRYLTAKSYDTSLRSAAAIHRRRGIPGVRRI